MNERVTVELTKEEAALFVLFMKHYHSIGLLMKHGVLDMRLGNATLNFSKNGELMSIKKETFHYSNELA